MWRLECRKMLNLLFFLFKENLSCNLSSYLDFLPLSGHPFLTLPNIISALCFDLNSARIGIASRYCAGMVLSKTRLQTWTEKIFHLQTSQTQNSELSSWEKFVPTRDKPCSPQLITRAYVMERPVSIELAGRWGRWWGPFSQESGVTGSAAIALYYRNRLLHNKK